MPPIPLRRLAAGATAAALLAGAFLAPAALAAADELLPETATPSIPAQPEPPASSDEPASSDAPAQPEPTAEPESTGESTAEPVAVAPVEPDVAPVSEPDAMVEPGAAPDAAPARPTTPATPHASLTGEATIAAGDTWVGTFTLDDADYVRIAALGSRVDITLTDSAGKSARETADNGYVDLGLHVTDPDGNVTVAIRNTAAAPQQVPYVLGWDANDITVWAVMSMGQPEIGVSIYPRRGETNLVASSVARVIAADGTERSLAMTGSAGYYRADFAGLAPGRYLVETESVVLGVRRYAVRTATVAAAETTAPGVAVATSSSPAAGGWFPGPVDVTLSASDTGSGVRSLAWGVDTSQLTSVERAATTFRVEGEGTHQVRYQARDWQDNVSALATRQINIDQTPPAVTLSGVADGDEFAQDERVAIEYACDDALSGIQSCVGDLGSGDFLDTSTVGAHTFRVTAVDRAGNERIVEHDYTVLAPDTTDPIVEVDVPEEPASGWYLDEVTVRLSASDESGIRRIHYEYGTTQGTVSRDVEADTAEVTFDRSQYYTLSYWAEDAAGNRSESRDLQLYVDATAPWVNMMSPEPEQSILPNGHYAQHERVIVDFSCDDDASGVATCEGTTADGGLLPTGSPGVHELRVVVTDLAGHRTERVVAYTVDAAPAPNGGGTGGSGGSGSGAPGLAHTGVENVVVGVSLAVLLLGAGAVMVVRRRARTR